MVDILLASMAVQLLRLIAQVVRFVVHVMPKGARKWSWVSRFGLISYAKALRRDFDALESECDEAGYRLVREGTTAILERLVIRHPNTKVERAKWRSFLGHIVAAAEDGGDITRARAIMDIPEFNPVPIVPASVSFGPMTASVTLSIRKQPKPLRNPIKWLRWKITKSPSHLIG